MSSSTTPGAISAAPDEPLLRRLMRATEVDTRMIGMIGALLLIWLGFHLYTLATTGEGLFITPRNLWNSARADLLDRGHGDRDGVGHRHAPY